MVWRGGGAMRIQVVVSGRRLAAMVALIALSLLPPALGSLHLARSHADSPLPPPGKPVVIDPGHGGIDGGASYGPVPEKIVNLDIALRVAARLEDRRVPVVLTRTTDVEFSLNSYREDLQRRHELAARHDAWALVAIHANASGNHRANGTLVLFQKDNEESRRLARILREALAAMQPDKHNLADVEVDHYYFDYSPVPTVVVEVGYMTNPDDRAALMQPEFRAKLADTIASALEAAWHSKP